MSQLLEHLRSVSQVTRRCADVGAHGVMKERVGIAPQPGVEQSWIEPRTMANGSCPAVSCSRRAASSGAAR